MEVLLQILIWFFADDYIYIYIYMRCCCICFLAILSSCAKYVHSCVYIYVCLMCYHKNSCYMTFNMFSTYVCFILVFVFNLYIHVSIFDSSLPDRVLSIQCAPQGIWSGRSGSE